MMKMMKDTIEKIESRIEIAEDQLSKVKELLEELDYTNELKGILETVIDLRKYIEHLEKTKSA